jgi:hypothetical protein
MMWGEKMCAGTACAAGKSHSESVTKHKPWRLFLVCTGSSQVHALVDRTDLRAVEPSRLLKRKENEHFPFDLAAQTVLWL